MLKTLQELDLYDILSFDAELGKTLQELQALVSRKQYIESMGGLGQDKISDLHFRGTPVEDLCLDFTLPGYPEYVLKAGDQNVCCFSLECSFVFFWIILFDLYLKWNLQVDLSNLEEYVSLVVDATVRTGIGRQMEAFRSGFNQVSFHHGIYCLFGQAKSAYFDKCFFQKCFSEKYFWRKIVSIG